VTNSAEEPKKLFYTVPEAAKVLRVDVATIYRSIREDAFPAVRLRTRYVVPAAAIEQMITRVMESGGVLDIAEMTRRRREEREFEQQQGRGNRW
jgi:excisionase family DNA binding protein